MTSNNIVGSRLFTIDSVPLRITSRLLQVQQSIPQSLNKAANLSRDRVTTTVGLIQPKEFIFVLF